MNDVARKIMKTLFVDPVILFSWGIYNFRIIDNGIRFTVNGYLHQGDVEIVYKDNKYTVSLFNEKNEVTSKKEEPLLKNLVDTVDKMVEYDENYKERVLSTYPDAKECFTK